MSVDMTALASGFVGLAIGAGVHFWREKQLLEDRCEFMDSMAADLSEAFNNAGLVLDDKNTPKPIRSAILALLSAHAEPERGRAFAVEFMTRRMEIKSTMPAEAIDPISQSMRVLGRYNPSLARQTHHVLASLSFGLVFLHLADDIKVERVRDEVAKDPVSLWSRISRLFGARGGRDQNHSDGNFAHA